MSDESPSSEARLRDLTNVIEGLERKTAPIPPPRKRQGVSEPELGTKTKFAVKVLVWFFRVYWVVWLTISLTVDPPLQLQGWLYVPFSALVCWLLFQFHKAITVAVAQRISKSRRS